MLNLMNSDFYFHTSLHVYQPPATAKTFRQALRKSPCLRYLSPSPKPLAFSPPPQSHSSPKVHSIEEALDYLILRDIGCSRSKAITLTSRNDRRNLIASLPKKVRKKFKLNARANKYQPYKIDDEDLYLKTFQKALDKMIRSKDGVDVNSLKNDKRLEFKGNNAALKSVRKLIISENNKYGMIRRVVSAERLTRQPW